MADSLSFRFAQEELVYLLRALNIKQFPGLENEPLGILDEDHQALALAVADRTLRAKGTICWDSEKARHVDPIVAGVLRDCALPGYTLLLDVLEVKKVRQRYLYSFGQHAVIEHCLPEPGLHQFVAIEAKDLLQHLYDLTAIPHDRLYDVGNGTVSAFETTMNVPETMHSLATEHSVNLNSDLSSIFKNPTKIKHFALWRGIPEETSNPTPWKTVTVIYDEQNLFLMPGKNTADTTANIIPATTSLIEEHIEQLLHPAFEKLYSRYER
jgi:hypothetical protein